MTLWPIWKLPLSLTSQLAVCLSKCTSTKNVNMLKWCCRRNLKRQELNMHEFQTFSIQIYCFQKYVSTSLDDALVAPLFSYMAALHHQTIPQLTSKPTHIPLEGFTIAVAKIFRGTIEEKSVFLMSLSQGSSEVDKDLLKKVSVHSQVAQNSWLGCPQLVKYFW